jgi:hypothetical protein
MADEIEEPFTAEQKERWNDLLGDNVDSARLKQVIREMKSALWAFECRPPVRPPEGACTTPPPMLHPTLKK